MRNLLMSIKPQYSQAILRGGKDVEFRRVFSEAASACDRVIIYESSPTMRIVGSFGIEKVDRPVRDTMDFTKAEQVVANSIRCGCKKGIQAQELLGYLLDAKSPCAIYINDVVRYEIPIDPRQIDPKFCPPQSYRWMPESLADVCEKTEWGNTVAIAARGGAFQ